MTSTTKCYVCNTEAGGFKCPKCKARYCGMGCYKKHSEGCVQQFHEEGFEQSGVGKERVGEDSKREMEMILLREKEAWDEEEGSDARREVLEAVERELTGGVLEEEEVMGIVERLPVDMREAFLKEVKETPDRIIAEAGQEDSKPWWAEAELIPPPTPKFPTNIINPANPPNTALTTHVIEVLCGYVGVCQVYEYSLDWANDPLGATELLFELTETLTPTKAVLYPTPTSALEAVSNKALLLDSFRSSDRFLLTALLYKDLSQLLNIPNILRALDHLRSTLTQSIERFPTRERSRGGSGKTLLKTAVKKLEFYMAFAAGVMDEVVMGGVRAELDDGVTGRREAIGEPPEGGWRNLVR